MKTIEKKQLSQALQTKSAATHTGKNGVSIENYRTRNAVQLVSSTDNTATDEVDVTGTGSGNSSHEVIQAKGKGVVQRWDWPWNWFKKKEENKYPEGLDPSEYRQYDFLQSVKEDEVESNIAKEYYGGRGFEHTTHSEVRDDILMSHNRRQESRDRSDDPTSKSVSQKLGTLSSIGGGIGSFITRLGSMLGNNKLGDSGRITGGVGGGLGVLGSGMDVILDGIDIVTSDEEKKDKALKGIGVLGSVGNVINSGTSGIGQIADYMGGLPGLSHLAGMIGAPAGIAKGGADVITGGLGGALSLYRGYQLDKMNREDFFDQSGIARFAGGNQKMKAVSNFGKAAGGALGVAGGAILLALGLSNPVGWGLLAGAGAVGGVMGLVNLIMKHRQGKLLEKTDYKRMLHNDHIEVPDDRTLDRTKKWTDIFKTKAMRRRDMVRGNIGMKLAENELSGGMHSGMLSNSDNSLSRISQYLGVKGLKGEDIPFDTSDLKKSRAKSYADALNF